MRKARGGWGLWRVMHRPPAVPPPPGDPAAARRPRRRRPAIPPPPGDYINPLSEFAACAARSNSGDGKIPNAIVAAANATATATHSG